MQQSRQGMRVGRAKFRAGDVDLAIHIWTKALESAYTTQDCAAVYVLSKNLGDAFGRRAKEHQQLQKQQQRAAIAAIEALQKSIDYYKYALNVIDECALLDVLGDESHLVLNRSAGHVQTTLKRQEVKMEKLKKLPPAIEEQPCTTCEELFEHLVLDDSDGCLYCQVCYDAFYASVESAEFESGSASLAVSAVVAPPPEPVSTHESRVVVKPSVSELPDDEGEREDAVKELSSGVEIVSSSVLFEEAAEAMATAAPTISASFEVTESHPESIEMHASEAVAYLQQQEPTAHVQTATKQVYSISELLALRTQSPVASCPEAILSSPVARNLDSATTGGGASAAVRKSSTSKQSKSLSKSKKAPVSHTSKARPPSVNLLSALPSVDLCNALRGATATTNGATSMADLEKLAASLFDCRASEPIGELTAADGDATLAPGPCHGGSFASDLALFATILKQ